MHAKTRLAIIEGGCHGRQGFLETLGVDDESHSIGRSWHVAAPTTGQGVSHQGSVNGKFAVLAYSAVMIRSLPLIGVLFLTVAATYLFVPADSLPSFFPGFKAGYSHINAKHAMVSLMIAIVAFVARREARSDGALRLLWSRETRQLGFSPR
jgi:hypothetical protein